MSHAGRVLTSPIFNRQRLNQWVAQIVVLVFITRSMNSESASFVKKPPPYRAFFRNHIRTNLRVPMVPTKSAYSSYCSQSSYGSHGAQSPPSSRSAYSSYGSYGFYCYNCYQCYYGFYATKRVNSTGSHPQSAVTQGSPVSSVQFQFRASQFQFSHSVKSDGRTSHTVEVKQSKSIHSVIRFILRIRFSQSRI